MYTDDNCIESFVNGLGDAKAGIVKFTCKTVFKANELYVKLDSDFQRIRQEYIVVGWICNQLIFLWKILSFALYVLARQLFCVRTEPLCSTNWNKVSYISCTDVYYDVYYDKSLLLNPFYFWTEDAFTRHHNYPAHYVETHIEDYLYSDADLLVLDTELNITPEYIRDYSYDDTMLFTRQLETGERVLRQLHADTIEPDFSAKIRALVPEKSDVRFLLVYVQFETPLKMYVVNVPIEEYYVGNELFSTEYLASYFAHQWIWESWGFDWRKDYTVRIMDSNLNIYEVKKGEFLALEKNDVKIFEMVDDVDEETKEEQDAETKEKQDEEQEESLSDENESRGVRTVSLEEDAETLLLFSQNAGKRERDNESDAEKLTCPSPDSPANKKMKYE